MASLSASDAEYVDAQMLHVDMQDGQVGTNCESSNCNWLSKFNIGIAYYIDVAVFYTWSREPANLPSSPSPLQGLFTGYYIKNSHTLYNKPNQLRLYQIFKVYSSPPALLEFNIPTNRSPPLLDAP